MCNHFCVICINVRLFMDSQAVLAGVVSYDVCYCECVCMCVSVQCHVLLSSIMYFSFHCLCTKVYPHFFKMNKKSAQVQLCLCQFLMSYIFLAQDLEHDIAL